MPRKSGGMDGAENKLSDAEQKEKENRHEGEDLGYYCIVIPGNGALQQKMGFL
jgi:hypothetical protein